MSEQRLESMVLLTAVITPHWKVLMVSIFASSSSSSGRHKLRRLDAVSCGEGLRLMRLCLLRSHCHEVHQKLRLVATVQQTQPTIQLLLSTSDFVGALDLITTTQEVLQQELQGVHSLR